MRCFIYILLLVSSSIYAQQISIDRGVLIDGLWCFPVNSDQVEYRYLPNKASLVYNEDGLPKFSFVRYMNDEVIGGEEYNSIKEVGGGGILSFMITYSTAKSDILNAQEYLREKHDNDEIVINGPIIFESGDYNLVSSIVTKDKNEKERKLISTGNAPILEGSQIALSFEVSPESSKLLLESFKMPTPDISVVFELMYTGLTDAYDAELIVNWEKVETYRKVNAGADIYFVSADVESEVQELLENKAVELKTSGEDEKSEALLNQAYQKIVDILFSQEDMAEDGTALMEQNNPLSNIAENTSPFNFLSIRAGYKHRDIDKKGQTKLSLNARNTVSRNHYITCNLGSLYREYGSNENIFKDIDLSDPSFTKREILIGIDGDLLPEFDKLINSVSVILKKKHQNGTETVEEARVLGKKLNLEKPERLSYKWQADKNKIEWLNYEYKAIYQFRGGERYEADWILQNDAMINLFVPYTRRTIQLGGNIDELKKHDVRALQVSIAYPFFGKEKALRKTIRPSDLEKEVSFEITLPVSQSSFSYKLDWYIKDGSILEDQGEWSGDILFIDELNQ